MPPRRITFKVKGEVFNIDPHELEIVNAETERHTVASDVAWWGSVAASAEAQAEKLAHQAEQWLNAAIVACVGREEKVSEWKAKSYAKSTPEYLALLELAADGNEVAGKARSVHWAFVRKMDMLNAMIGGENATKRSAGAIGQVPHEHADDANDPRLSVFRQRRQKSPQEG